MKKLLAKIALLGLITYAMSPSVVQAAELTQRSLTLGNSAASASTTYQFSFRPGTTGNVGAVRFQICDSPLAANPCNPPSSATAAGANGLTLSGEIGGTTGFTIASGTPPAPTATTVWITDPTPESLTTGVSSTVRFSTIVNPNQANLQFYARITTYSDSNGSTAVDSGSVAVSTAEQITVTGTMPESLIFCVGTTWTTSCSDIAGSAVSLGTFSPTATSTGTSVMAASTNAGSGYAITINGTTMTSGINTIPPLGTQTLNSNTSAASVIGTSQFGTNVRNNTVPLVGADVSGSGTAAGFQAYNVGNQFRFFSGDTVATVGGSTNLNIFTSSYIVNVGGSQAAGLYSATLTYICTATF
jgi:hypothetical protein